MARSAGFGSYILTFTLYIFLFDFHLKIKHYKTNRNILIKLAFASPSYLHIYKLANIITCEHLIHQVHCFSIFFYIGFTGSFQIFLRISSRNLFQSFPHGTLSLSVFSNYILSILPQHLTFDFHLKIKHRPSLCSGPSNINIVDVMFDSPLENQSKAI